MPINAIEKNIKILDFIGLRFIVWFDKICLLFLGFSATAIFPLGHWYLTFHLHIQGAEHNVGVPFGEANAPLDLLGRPFCWQYTPPDLLGRPFGWQYASPEFAGVPFGWHYAPPDLLGRPFGGTNALPVFAESLF